MEIDIKWLHPNIKKIEKELRQFGFLVKERVEPYNSLHCFKGVNYDKQHCLESCPRVEDCFSTFLDGGYLI